MSQASKLLNGLSEKEIKAYSAGAGASEAHITIGYDRVVRVPEALKKVAVEHDHNVETVTFDCPRYWDGLDISKMRVYINYKLSNGYTDSYPAEVTSATEDIMNFSWTISANVTQVKGPITFLICIKKTDDEDVEVNHWNSELCKDMFVAEGMECQEGVPMEYTDLVNGLLERMDVVEQINVDAQTMQELLSATQSAVATAEEVKNEALDASNYIKNSYAPAIKGKVSGKVIRVDDVSPIEHDVTCLVHGKNLFDISKVTNTNLITNNGDGTITIAENTFYVPLAQKLSDLCPGLRVGDVATFNMTTDSSFSKYIYLHGIGGTWNVGTYITITEEILNSYVCVYGYIKSDPLYGQKNILSNIQIEKGIVATEYEPYIDPSTVTVIRCGKNLLDVDFMCNAAMIKAGDVYTFKKGATSDERFTDVVPVYIPANTDICISAIFDDYTVTDDSLYMIIKYADGTEAFTGIAFKDRYRHIHTAKDIVAFKFYIQGTQEAGAYIAFRKIQLEFGTEPTVYEPYTKHEATVDAKGICSVKSTSPNMVIYNNVSGALIEAEYNRDTTKMFESYTLTDEAKAEIAAIVESDVEQVLAALNEYSESLIGGGS